MCNTTEMFQQICYLVVSFLMLLMTVTASAESVGPTKIKSLTISVDGDTVTLEIEETFSACAVGLHTISFVYDEATNSANYMMALSTAYAADMEIFMNYIFQGGDCKLNGLFIGSST